MNCLSENSIPSVKETLTSLSIVIVTCFVLIYGFYHVADFEISVTTMNEPKENRILVNGLCSISKLLDIDAVKHEVHCLDGSISNIVEKNIDICVRSKYKNRLSFPEFHRGLKHDLSVTSSVKMESIVYITISGGSAGRLGNRMFQYAALLGISVMAQENGLRAVAGLSNTSHLQSLFSAFKLTLIKTVNMACPIQLVEEKPMAFSKTVVSAIDRGFNYSLRTYFQSWKYFENISHIIRQEFQFTDDILKETKKFLIQIAKDITPNTTFVGVHIRRGDMTLSSSVKRGYSTAGAKYLANALAYYRAMFSNVVFIVCSDDINWAMTNINGSEVHFSKGNKAEVDMALLSLCDHSVITSGSFGWWSAWLAGGRVVYYKDFPTPGSWLDSMFERSDYYPPHWLGLT